MARVPRCLLSDLSPGRHALDDGTRHHLGRVLRLQDGDALEFVDGRGGLARGRWSPDGRVHVEEWIVAPAPVPRRIVLAVAPPRPSRLDWLVEKAAELGVHTLALLDSAHTVRDVGPARLERLARKAEEAMLQCRRLHVMTIAPPRPLSAVLAEAGDAPIWLACPPEPRDATPPPLPVVGDVTLLVGPEGGFHAEEQTAAHAAGAQRVALGSGVLRVETAALAMVVLAGPP